MAEAEAQSVSSSSIHRSSNGLIAGQTGGISQSSRSCLAPARSQFGAMDMLGDFSNLAPLDVEMNPGFTISLLNQGVSAGSGLSTRTAPSLSQTVQHSLPLGGVDSLKSIDLASTDMQSPTSFSSTSLKFSESSSAVASSLIRQEANRFDGQDTIQQHQQYRQHISNMISRQQQAHQEQQHVSMQQELQIQGLGNGQHLQGPHIFGVGSGSLVQRRGQLQSQVHVHSPHTSERVKMEASSNNQQFLLHQRLPVVKEEAKTDDNLCCQMVQRVHQKPDVMITPLLQRQEVLLNLQRQNPQQLQMQLNLFQQRLLHQKQQQQQQQQQQQHHHHHHQQQGNQQQHQQQQLLQTSPQRLLSQQQQQSQYHFQQQANLQITTPKPLGFESGACSRKVLQYIYHQRRRPSDNNIAFWKKFVAEYFAPRGKKRWCVSLYGSGGRQPAGVFPQDVWQCEICGAKPGKGFETTVEVLPRLCKIKYDSGILEELLFVDLPHEYRLNPGVMVLEYEKAIQESIFDQLRVVRDGRLRIMFSQDLKILSWEFCARSHEELLPRRVIIPQVTQLAKIAQKYQTSLNQNGSSGLSLQDLQSNCQLFMTTSRQLARNLEVPTVNDLGYTKRYVRCLQISEVVNSMKDLIEFSLENHIGPIASLLNFPRRSPDMAGVQGSSLQQQQAQLPLQGLSSDESNNLSSSHVGSNYHYSTGGGATANGLSNSTNHNAFPNFLQKSCASNVTDPRHKVLSKQLGINIQPLGCSSTSMQVHTDYNSFQSSHSPPVTPSVNDDTSNFTDQHAMNLSGNVLPKPSLQSVSKQNDSQSIVHLLQEMANSQVNQDGQFHQRVGGGTSWVVHGAEGASGRSINSLGSSTLINSGVANVGTRVDNSGAGGLTTGFMNGGGNFLTGLGGGMRNLGSNMMGLDNIDVVNVLGGKFNMVAVPQQQNLHHGHNDEMTNSLNGTNYGNLHFNWKSS